MKIDTPTGTPIWVSPRRDNGVTLIQGKSHVMVSAAEIPRVIQAIMEVSGASGNYADPELIAKGKAICESGKYNQR